MTTRAGSGKQMTSWVVCETDGVSQLACAVVSCHCMVAPSPLPVSERRSLLVITIESQKSRTSRVDLVFILLEGICFLGNSDVWWWLSMAGGTTFDLGMTRMQCSEGRERCSREWIVVGRRKIVGSSSAGAWKVEAVPAIAESSHAVRRSDAKQIAVEFYCSRASLPDERTFASPDVHILYYGVPYVHSELLDQHMPPSMHYHVRQGHWASKLSAQCVNQYCNGDSPPGEV